MASAAAAETGNANKAATNAAGKARSLGGEERDEEKDRCKPRKGCGQEESCDMAAVPFRQGKAADSSHLNSNNSHLRREIRLFVALSEHSSKKLDTDFEKFLHVHRRNSKRIPDAVRGTSSLTRIRETPGVSLQQVLRVSF
ncbi:hypothetical protein [Herbaspirillum sp. 1130]|uniref:hypothetical protein n=1 Tax=Herbaspirillum sp. 1130 TaxID=2806562 RepID=UPI001B6701C7|nr:hypothetical protein [Herbaspirillum sp. 1130]MBP1315782.1 hypothetical protein [Herbaspirillum sp. 1130]